MASDVELTERFRRVQLYSLAVDLGFQLVAFKQAERAAEVTFDAPERFCNGFGSVHGGIVAAMLDLTAAMAAIGASGLGIAVPTLEMKTSFLSPTKPGRLLGFGRALRMGRSVAFLEAELHDADHKLLAKASITAKPVAFDWTSPRFRAEQR